MNIFNYFFGVKWAILLLWHSDNLSATLQSPHCVKSVQIRSFFCSVFSCIRTEYSVSISVSLRIHSKCGKIRTTKNSVLGHLSCSAKLSACQAQSITREIVITLEKLQDDGYFLLLCKEVLIDLKQLNIDEPAALRRKRKPSQRI